MNGIVYKKAMVFMIALAVSTLSGNAILHLLPSVSARHSCLLLSNYLCDKNVR